MTNAQRIEIDLALLRDFASLRELQLAQILHAKSQSPQRNTK